MTAKQLAKDLIAYIKKSVSPYHVVETSMEILKKQGFEELDFFTEWKLEAGKKYLVKPYGTQLFAFSMPSDIKGRFALRIAAAHTDAPGLHIKPVAELAQKNYLRLNTDIYGGPILNTWLDRPLSIAGRVALASEDLYKPELVLVDFEKPVLTIPNLAIHMNREVNKGVELKKQSDMLPLLGMGDKDNQAEYFLKLLAKKLKVKKEDILDFDLYVYNKEDGCFTGMKEEFISAPRLDNLTSCFALTNAIAGATGEKGILSIAALYDNEEIGSRTKQGANSALLTMMLEKIYAACGKQKTELDSDMMSGYLMSVDVAHALHPNKTDKYDPVNYSLMNDGVVLKMSSNQSYAMDTEAIAIAQQLCKKAGVKYKKFVNNSDVAGGGTLGPIISTWLPMKAIDIGAPILAMHSARELMGTEDQMELEKLVAALYNEG